MFALFVSFFLLACLVSLAGVCLAHSADKIAEITGLGHMLVGSVLLAGATSLPELTIDITAIRLKMPDLATGDLVGSSLINLLILAGLDLTHYSRGRMLSREAAGHALSGMLSIALTAIVGFAILTSNRLPNVSLLGVSAPAIMILIAYVLGGRMIYLDQRVAARSAAEPAAGDSNEKQAPGKTRLWLPVAGFLLGTLVLVLTGPRLAETAGELADATGLGKTFIGTTLVALCTSLPELVASLTTVKMKAYDLAIGNIFGSNAFNMILFAPLDLLHDGSLFAAVSPTHVITCLATIVATSIAVMGQLYQVERRRPIIEPDAWLMIGVVSGAFYLVYRLS